MDTIGERIANLRKKKGLDQQVLGDLLGVTKQQVSRYEKGQSVLNVDQAKIVAQALYTTVTYLIDGETKLDQLPEGYSLVKTDEIVEQVKVGIEEMIRGEFKSLYAEILEENRIYMEENRRLKQQSETLKNISVVPPDKSELTGNS